MFGYPIKSLGLTVTGALIGWKNTFCQRERGKRLKIILQDRLSIALGPAGGHRKGSRYQGRGKRECQNVLERQENREVEVYRLKKKQNKPNLDPHSLFYLFSHFQCPCEKHYTSPLKQWWVCTVIKFPSRTSELPANMTSEKQVYILTLQAKSTLSICTFASVCPSSLPWLFQGTPLG